MVYFLLHVHTSYTSFPLLMISIVMRKCCIYDKISIPNNVSAGGVHIHSKNTEAPDGVVLLLIESNIYAMFFMSVPYSSFHLHCCYSFSIKRLIWGDSFYCYTMLPYYTFVTGRYDVHCCCNSIHRQTFMNTPNILL